MSLLTTNVIHTHAPYQTIPSFGQATGRSMGTDVDVSCHAQPQSDKPSAVSEIQTTWITEKRMGASRMRTARGD
jgi:hypothetical protein